MVVAGLLVWAGLFTPVFSVALAAGALIAALSNLSATTERLLDGPFAGMVMAVGFALALLGPGAFSVDFRLFGRREIIIPRNPNVGS